MVEPVWISPRCVVFFHAASALLAWWLWTASVWTCPAVSLFVCPFSVLQYLYLSVHFLFCNIFICLSTSDNSFAGGSNFVCTFLLSGLVLCSPGFYSCWGEKRKHNVGREGGDTELNGKTPSTLGAASWCPQNCGGSVEFVDSFLWFMLVMSLSWTNVIPTRTVYYPYFSV